MRTAADQYLEKVVIFLWRKATSGQPSEPSPCAVEIAQKKRAIKTGWGDGFTQALEKL
ncbi:hypothetical protein [Synechococcus sp. CC9616]|uniref:hypothetical protein n=1 Tax=Synechococcus sp. CC9616 TaxID=110663 RepID=UPI001E49A101|nr:hypothetical protein [Synechococcus sp. CC9616]